MTAGPRGLHVHHASAAGSSVTAGGRATAVATRPPPVGPLTGRTARPILPDVTSRTAHLITRTAVACALGVGVALLFRWSSYPNVRSEDVVGP